MSRPVPSPSDGAAAPRPVFARVICAIDASPTDAEAARQAAAMAGPDGLVEFVAVSWETGVGLNRIALLAHKRADEALGRASRSLAALGVTATSTRVEAKDPATALMDQATSEDLLVLGSHGHSRSSGIMLGTTASTVLHRADVPVLIARVPPEESDFPHPMVVASDGSPTARRAALLGAAIARRRECHLDHVHVQQQDGDRVRRALAEETAAIKAVMGQEPAIAIQYGEPTETILRYTLSVRAALLIMGSRGLGGLRALGSVSERVAHRAKCSVLVVRPPGED